MNRRLMVLRQLDHQRLSFKDLGAHALPKGGWVRTLRKALGMTIKQLAARLDVTSSRVVKIEMAEVSGRTTLRTLEAVAEALDCRLAYYFVPKTSFEGVLKSQAKKVALKHVKRTAHTMRLEGQSVKEDWLKMQVKDLSDELLRQPWKHLWEEQ